MAKKRRKKRKLKRKSFERKVIGPGISLKRQGRRLIMSSSFTPSQQQQLKRVLEEQARTVPKEIDKAVAELRELIRELPTLQLLSNLTADVLYHDPEQYKEYEQKPLIMIEYPTWLCLLENNPVIKMHFIDGPEMERVIQIIEKLMVQIRWYFQLEYLRKGRETPSGEDEIVYGTRTYDLAVRNPGYPIHQDEINRGLFKPYDDELRDLLGSRIEDANKIIGALEAQINEGMHERLEKARETEKEWIELVEQYKKSGKVNGELPEPLKDMVEKLPVNEVRKHIRNSVIAWCWFGMEDALTVSSADLQKRTNLPLETVKAFLQRFSLEFGQEPIANSWPSRYEPLELCPLIRVSDDQYFAHLTTKLPWAIKPNLEDALAGRSELWEKYQKHRATYLEKETLRLLETCMSGSQGYHKLKYIMPNEEGVDTEYELDGLIIYDTVLMLIECKAGTISAAAKRGAPSFSEDIESTIQEAQEQAIRARKYISSKGEVTFRQNGGSTITINSANYNRIILVSSTLDDLTAFTSRAAILQKIGMLGIGDLPWPITPLNLNVVAEIIEFGPQLIHYLERRGRLSTELITSYDELDFFGHYLSFGLDFSKEASKGATRIVLLTHTSELDDYYLYKMGQRKTPAPKPKQNLPPEIRKQLTALVSEGNPGFVDKSCRLLDTWKPRID